MRKKHTEELKPVGKLYSREEVEQIINMYKMVIHGDSKTTGMESAIDGYYSDCWNESLAEIDEWIKYHL